jgi:hypothetical protein
VGKIYSKELKERGIESFHQGSNHFIKGAKIVGRK